MKTEHKRDNEENSSGLKGYGRVAAAKAGYKAASKEEDNKKTLEKSVEEAVDGPDNPFEDDDMIQLDVDMVKLEELEDSEEESEIPEAGK